VVVVLGAGERATFDSLSFSQREKDRVTGLRLIVA